MNKPYIDKLAYILIKNRRVMFTWEIGKTAWIIPGGKREKRETDIEVLAREIKEELFVDLIQDTVKFLKIYEGQAYGHPEGTLVRISCYICGYTGNIRLNPPVEKIAWIDSKENNVSVIGKMLLKDLKDQNLID